MNDVATRHWHALCGGELAAVLDTLVYLKRETSVWFEVTTLLIPGENDAPAEIEAASRWFTEHLGPDVPWHFIAFHPDYRMRDKPPTPTATLRRAREIARAHGIRHVYTGNVHDPDGQSTYCASCGATMIARDGYGLSEWNLTGEGRCLVCGARCAGVFDGAPGTWGARRVPVRLARAVGWA